MQENYTIAMEIKSETYFGKGIFLFDLAFIFVYWYVFSMFENLIHPLLALPYTIFNILVAFILTRKSSKNPGKRIYQEVLYKIMAAKKMSYHCRECGYEEIQFVEEK